MRSTSFIAYAWEALSGPRSRRFFLGTFIGDCLIAAALISVRPETHWAATFWYSQFVGLITCALCLLVIPRLRDQSVGALQAVLWLGSTALLGTLIGNAIGLLMLKYVYGITESRPGLLASVLISLAAGAAAGVYFYNRERLLRVQSELEAQQWRALAAQRMATESELKALQAQIEPHFLFNTLAHISAALDESPATARIMLNDLVAYLRASLRHARNPVTTLAEELKLNEKLLIIMQHRMGERLKWAFDVEPGLEESTISPMLIQPLVENAVKHGLEPKVEGGKITVRAWKSGNLLQVEVSDDGLGLNAPQQVSSKADGGSGLVNIVQRLKVLYGPQAKFDLTQREHLTIASLTVPLNMPAASAHALTAVTAPV